MQQMRIDRMGNGMFHAPQTGPSMSPAFMFANEAQEPPPMLAQQAPAAPQAQAQPSVVVPIPPPPPGISWKDWAGPAAVIVLVGALVAWNVR